MEDRFTGIFNETTKELFKCEDFKHALQYLFTLTMEDMKGYNIQTDWKIVLVEDGKIVQKEGLSLDIKSCRIRIDDSFTYHDGTTF